MTLPDARAELTLKEMNYLIDSLNKISPGELGEKVLPDYRRYSQNIITKTGMLTRKGYPIFTDTRGDVFVKLIKASERLNSIAVEL